MTRVYLHPQFPGQTVDPEPITTTDPLGHTYQYEYTSAWQVSKVTDLLGNVTTFTYDGSERRTSATKTRTTPSGVEMLVTSWEYDKNGRINQDDLSGWSSTRMTWTLTGKRESTFDEQGRRRTSRTTMAIGLSRRSTRMVRRRGRGTTRRGGSRREVTKRTERPGWSTTTSAGWRRPSIRT